MIRILVLFMIVITYASCSNTRNLSTTTNKTAQNVAVLKPQTKKEEHKLARYIDDTYDYEVEIPKWFKVIASSNPKSWGGTLPSIDGVENAILITGFDKKDFESFQDFKNKIVENNVFGKPLQMNSAHLSMGHKVLDEVPNIGPAYKQYLMWNGGTYDCQFVLAETQSGYIWVNFTATRETYDKNIGKFNDFLKGLKIKK